MLTEILEMPSMAKEFLEKSSTFTLPTGVPYLGMGSSYFAALAFKYMGINISPELASEYYNYLHKGTKAPLAVLLSQSGKSSEVLWCRELFEKYIAISNYGDSPLCNAEAASAVVELFAGEEKYSSSKTYINTLLALCKGFGIDAHHAVEVLAARMNEYEKQGSMIADEIFELVQQEKVHGLYITGSGPNIATAYQATLILSESTKLAFTALPMGQYDHGPKETAKSSVVINILAKGRTYDRTVKLGQTIAAAGATVFTVEEPAVPENLSVINNIVPFNYLAYYLAQKLGVGETFVVGGKVTEVV